MKNTHLKVLGKALVGSFTVLAATAIILLAVINRGFNVAWRLWAKVLAIPALVILWPIADHCLIHWSASITGDSLLTEIVARGRWITGLQVTLADGPHASHAYHITSLIFGLITLHVFLYVLFTSEQVRIETESWAEDITAAAEHYIERAVLKLCRKAPKTFRSPGTQPNTSE